MHRYRIVAQISLILSILNLVLAAPIAVQEIHEARGNKMVVAEDVAAKPNKRLDSDSTSDRWTPPPSSPEMPPHTSGSGPSELPLPEPPSLHLPVSLPESAFFTIQVQGHRINDL
jgi:hypothetical protein